MYNLICNKNAHWNAMLKTRDNEIKNPKKCWLFVKILTADGQ